MAGKPRVLLAGAIAALALSGGVAQAQLPPIDTDPSPDELRNILSADRDAFARAITSKLLTYALGRGLERYDQRTVKLIASRLPKYDYKFSGLVLEIVNSLPFQSRRSSTDVPTATRPTAANSSSSQ